MPKRCTVLFRAAASRGAATKLSATLQEPYPKDRANGLRQGELRGASTITRPM